MNDQPIISDEMAIYQSKLGSLEIKAKITQETIWLTLDQIATLFDVQKAAISKHIKNIYQSSELEEEATVSKMETVRIEGKRKVRRNLEYYNLDLVLSVGYRVNSKKATHFRQWATKTLKEYTLKGYSFNPERIKLNYENFLQAVNEVKHLLPIGNTVANETILDLIILFSETWLSLDAYDKDEINTQGITQKKVTLTAEKLSKSLYELKQNLISTGNATDLFAKERNKESLQGIIGNIMQSFDGKDLYPTVEEKAANLLYLIIKNHPFVDGNKRSGAYAFVWFLRQAKILDISRITPPALTALTLLIAESSPKDKGKMVGLICLLLSNQGIK